MLSVRILLFIFLSSSLRWMGELAGILTMLSCTLLGVGIVVMTLPD